MSDSFEDDVFWSEELFFNAEEIKAEDRYIDELEKLSEIEFKKNKKGKK